MTLPRDTLIICGTDRAMAEAAERWPWCPRIRRDVLSDEDQAEWSGLSLRSEYVVPLEVSDELQKQYKELMEKAAQNRMTSLKRSRIRVEHLLRNLHYLWERPNLMAGGVTVPCPAFIVGAGPSLEKNRQYLEREHGLIIAVNSASKQVDAHLTLCIESNDVRHKLEGKNYACGLICDPRVMAQAPSLQVLWTGELGGLIADLTGIPVLSTSVSGTTAAVSLATRLGCNPIVLVGQDLAWTDGKIYADGGSATVDGNSVRLVWEGPEYERAEPLPEAMDARHAQGWASDSSVLTSPPFLGVRDWLTQWARMYSDEAQFINATEGGLNVPAWENWRLQDIARGTKSHLIAAPPVPKELVGRWVSDELFRLRTVPHTSMLLDYWLTDRTIEILDHWREHGRLEHLEELQGLTEELIADGAGELRDRIIEWVGLDCVPTDESRAGLA